MTGFTEDGEPLDEDQCRRLFDLSAIQGKSLTVPQDMEKRLAEFVAHKQKALLEELEARNANWFEIEIDKLDRWAQDRRTSLKVELDELDEAIKETRKAARLAPNLPEKLEKQQALRKLKSKHDEAWRNYDQASRELDKQKEALLDEIGKQLEQNTEWKQLFVIHWELT